MTRPFVSICIPAYRAEKYLAATLQSVAAQTFTDWEVIVTEDGSKDRAEEIVRIFAATVRQSVTYNRHEKNCGLPATRNTGIKTAQGDWVAFLDSDDLWRPEHLAALIGKTADLTVDMVFSGTIPFDDETGREFSACVPSARDLEALPIALFTGRLSILPSSVLIRKAAFNQYGQISADFPQVNDTEYWLRILRGGGRVAFSGQNTCLYRKHPAAMSRRAAEILTDSARLCERYADWSAIPRFLRRARPADLYRWAGRSLLAYDPAAARRALTRSLKLEPFNLKNLGLWAKAALSRARREAV